MKKLKLMWIFGVLFCTNLFPQTMIEGGETFQLGENEHEAYSFSVKNIGAHPVSIITMSELSQRSTIKTLSPNQTFTLNVNKNQPIYFENKNKSKAFVKINFIGNPILSLNYKNN
jgi:hypothetical protein